MFLKIYLFIPTDGLTYLRLYYNLFRLYGIAITDLIFEFNFACLKNYLVYSLKL
jgi:cyanate lyase